ncbi:MAG: hypothetical protein IPK82_17475 [Polyangiaceae bacterium]|nr:hypothetical protein [Polyangiaceae bacterium]
MDQIKVVLELLKNAAYEILAILLPGTVIVELLRLGSPATGVIVQNALKDQSELRYVAFAYIAGTAMQGLARLLPTRWSTKTANQLRARAMEVLDQAYPDGTNDSDKARYALGICLSYVGDKRAVYDKFLGLRDMMRGLTAASAIGLLAMVVKILAGYGRSGNSNVAADVLAAAVFFLCGVGFGTAHQKYGPVPEEALYSTVIAMRIGPQKPVAKDPS